MKKNEAYSQEMNFCLRYKTVLLCLFFFFKLQLFLYCQGNSMTSPLRTRPGKGSKGELIPVKGEEKNNKKKGGGPSHSHNRSLSKT